MASTTIIFDSTWIKDPSGNGQCAWETPVSGASLCAWLGLGKVIPWAPPKYVPKLSDFLRVIDASLGNQPFSIGFDVYKYYGGAPYSSLLLYPPKVTPHSFQLDFELSYLSTAAPSYYGDIMKGIVAKHPGIRLLTYVPCPLRIQNDSTLKVQSWTPTTTAINYAKSFATTNAAWISQLWGIVLPCYFGNPKYDQQTIWLYYNTIKLARAAFPTSRILVQTTALRDTTWYPAGGSISDSSMTNWVGTINTAHLDGVIVWGQRSQQLKLLQKFGVGANLTPATIGTPAIGNMAPIIRTPMPTGETYTPKLIRS